MIYLKLKKRKILPSEILKKYKMLFVPLCAAMLYSCSSTQKLHVLVCPGSTINKWLDSTNHVGNIILQFNSPNIKKSNKNMEAIAYAFTTSNYYLDSIPALLPKTEKLSKGFSGTAIFGNNVLSIAELKMAVSDSLGHKIIFDNLFFTPKKGPNNYIFYSLSLSVPGGSVMYSSVKTNPCPPAICLMTKL